ncbi:MAG: hypothetical protein KBS82_05430 [Oscillospiraceae bacterium]|nr:hypothetical protein [Candidatus Limimonas egerieequi]
MFREEITDTPFMAKSANMYFEKVNGEYWRDDCSFVTTLRILLRNKINEDSKGIYVSFGYSDYTAKIMEDNSDSRILNCITRDFVKYPDEWCEHIHIHSFNASDDINNDAFIDLVKKKFTEQFPNYVMLDKVETFYHEQFNCVCFINPTTRDVIIYVCKLDIKKLHYLQCSIFAILPWYFNPDEGISDIDMELIQSLREKTSAHYCEVVNKIASEFNFREEYTRKVLAGFETKFERQELSRKENEIRDLESRIREYNENIKSLLQRKEEYDTILFGLRYKIENESENDSEIMEYFLRNPHLYLENVDDRSIDFIAQDYVTYYDEDLVESVLDNRNSFIYRVGGRFMSDVYSAEEMKRFMTRVFIDQKMKIKFCAAYRFIFGRGVEGLKGYRFGMEFNDSMPNPHINRYSCLGNYNMSINTSIQENDYLTALEQCIASCKSLNFGDSCVMEEFMRFIYGVTDNPSYNNISCVELEDGRCLTVGEAMDWLNENEGTIVTEEEENNE